MSIYVSRQMYFDAVRIWRIFALVFIIHTTNADVFGRLGITDNTTVADYIISQKMMHPNGVRGGKLLTINSAGVRDCIDFSFGSTEINFLEEGIPKVVKAFYVSIECIFNQNK